MSGNQMNTEFRQWVSRNAPGFRIRSAASVATKCQELIDNFDAVFKSSAGMNPDEGPRMRDFHLREHTVPFSRGTLKEARAERGIVKHYAVEGNSIPLPNCANLVSIDSYQVPLQPHGAKKKTLAAIDLMGATGDGLPAIIELKTGTGWGGVNGLFHSILEGVAYALTIRYAWPFFQSEWRAEIRNDAPERIEESDTPVIVMADDAFINQRREYLDTAWPVMSDWMSHLSEHHLPISFARFDDAFAFEFVPYHEMRISQKSIGGAFSRGQDGRTAGDGPFIS
ncbi:MAG: hypothetical protein P1U58_14170 [Verrucomicrobiales bacterium]|nr:hypothetical protein [Verrucomicrobiales bacterium]